jgi:hypothetical protein
MAKRGTRSHRGNTGKHRAKGYAAYQHGSSRKKGAGGLDIARSTGKGGMSNRRMRKYMSLPRLI